ALTGREQGPMVRIIGMNPIKLNRRTGRPRDLQRTRVHFLSPGAAPGPRGPQDLPHGTKREEEENAPVHRDHHRGARAVLQRLPRPADRRLHRHQAQRPRPLPRTPLRNRAPLVLRRRTRPVRCPLPRPGRDPPPPPGGRRGDRRRRERLGPGPGADADLTPGPLRPGAPGLRAPAPLRPAARSIPGRPGGGSEHPAENDHGDEIRAPAKTDTGPVHPFSTLFFDRGRGVPGTDSNRAFPAPRRLRVRSSAGPDRGPDRPMNERDEGRPGSPERPGRNPAKSGGPDQSSAASRSATRSSADSMPTESRTRSAGTSSGEPAVEACVIRAGCSISDSTPPSDSPRANSRARPQTRTA